RLLDGDPTLARLVFENGRVCRGRGRLDARAIAHASQECLVGEVVLVEVRRENDELFKWNFDLFSGVQREIVDTTLERHDPAVQKILRCDSLTAEVVDHERAAV